MVCWHRGLVNYWRNVSARKMKKPEMYQNIILELADGRLVRATVPAFCHIRDKVSVRDIRVTNPEKLPDNCSFEDKDRK